MSFSVSDDVIKLLVADIADILTRIDKEEDVRYALALLPRMASKLKSMADLNDTPHNRWISYILHDQLGNLQSAYDGKPDEWYKLNARNIEQLRKIWRSFFEKLSIDLSKKDYDKIIDDSRDFFFELHRLVRETTMVRKE